MFSFSKFEQDIRNNLNKSSKTLINNLNQITSLNFNPNIDLIDLEIFIELTRFEIDIMMFSMDKEGNEVFNESNKDKYFAGSKQIVSEIQFYYDESILEDEDFFEMADEIGEKVIIEWFISCWEESSCNDIKLPIYVGMHDCLKSYNLKSCKWIAIEDKYI